MIDYLKDLVTYNADKVPFLMSIVAGAPKVQISMQRVIEAAVTAGVLAIIGYVAIIPRLEERMVNEFQTIRRDIDELKQTVRNIESQRQEDYRDLQKQINRRDK